jgi:hypothetical protein
LYRYLSHRSEFNYEEAQQLASFLNDMMPFLVFPSHWQRHPPVEKQIPAVWPDASQAGWYSLLDEKSLSLSESLGVEVLQ